MKTLLMTLITLTSLQAQEQENVVTTQAPEQITVKDGELQNPEQVIQKTKGNGTNVYNFNFYNQKPQGEEVKEVAPKEEKVVKLVTLEEEVVPLPPVKPIEHRSGFEFTLGTVPSTLEADINKPKLTSQSDIKVGRIIMDESGKYYTPGLIFQSVGANWRTDDINVNDDFEGDGWGGYLKIGRHTHRKAKYKYDIGFEFSFTAGKLEESGSEFKNLFDDYQPTEIKYQQAAGSAYGGPIYQITDSFLLAGVINVGLRNVRIDGSTEVDTFWGLHLNSTFKF